MFIVRIAVFMEILSFGRHEELVNVYCENKCIFTKFSFDALRAGEFSRNWTVDNDF